MILESNFLGHWKTVLLRALLGEDDKAPLYVLAIWLHLFAQRTDVLRAEPEVVRAIAGYNGSKTAEEFVAALVKSEYFHRVNKNLLAHEFREMNARAFAAWDNGNRGGRPRKDDEKGISVALVPVADNPAETQEEPEANLSISGRLVGRLVGRKVGRKVGGKTDEKVPVEVEPGEDPEETPEEETIGRCPHEEMRLEWNRLCGASGLRSSRIWPEVFSRTRWADRWFRENWKAIFAEAHRNSWCRENRVGPEHVLRPLNALRYYEQDQDRKKKRGGAGGAPLEGLGVRIAVKHPGGAIEIKEFATPGEASEEFKKGPYARDTVNPDLWLVQA